jgi:phosphate transport system permease protein
MLLADGRLHCFDVREGSEVSSHDPFQGERPSAWAVDMSGEELALGFSDGRVRLGKVRVDSRQLPVAQFAEKDRLRAAGDTYREAGQVYELLPSGMVRSQSLALEFDEASALSGGPAIVAIDRSDVSGRAVMTALDAEWNLHVASAKRTLNLLTDEETVTFKGGKLALTAFANRGRPLALLLSGGGDGVILAWSDGTAARVDARVLETPVLAEQLDLVADPGLRLTALRHLNGKTTLLAGDSAGRVSTWFLARDSERPGSDGQSLVLAQTVECGSEITALASSKRTRVAAAGLADGSTVCLYATTGSLLARGAAPSPAPVELLALSPKDDVLSAFGQGRCYSWSVHAPHPEAGLASYLRPVRYEGSSRPEHVWQSSSGSDDFEPKLGLVPLVFGTIKATLYSLLFGVPLALLAALYTSEFLHPRARLLVKSVIEVMAGLPSVVLGFLSAIVIAPFVQGHLSTVLASFYTVPLALLLGSQGWQMLPGRTAVRWSGWQRLLAIVLSVPIGLALARLVGPWTERALFDGDVALWLGGRGGGAWSGWFVLLLPLCALATAVCASLFLARWIRRATAPWTRAQCARFDALRFLLGLGATVGLAWVLGRALGGLGLDPRGGVVDTYVQRNALVVGFVMGFAIVPIIYTIAEDALSSVPTQLRLASLGAGATVWQTSLRIVVPTALSGLFSAVMVGLGRAVGETMIVLMATGNTPVMEWNVFNGFRTLSANIAVELPEAVQGDTHYRTLFLAALALFAMTFVVNTAAEVVRQRFRKRAYQL